MADVARKGDAGLDTLEWFASLGMSLDEFRERGDPPARVVRARMRRNVQQMHDDEQGWRGAG